MQALFKYLLSSCSSLEESPLSESERLLGEIEESRKKIDHAWNHFHYADPEYIEISVLELLLAETQYSILNKRYRIMLGVQEKSSHWATSEIKSPLFSIESRLQSHAFYGAFFSNEDNSNPAVAQLLSQNSIAAD
jgi:hypothetical protein